MAESSPGTVSWQQKTDLLRRLHHGPGPLVLTNIWDAAGAQLVRRAGYPAVATSSAAIAASLGHRDDDSMPIADALGVVSRIVSSVDLPVTADMEAGYGVDPEELVERLRDTGAVGCNLEDSDHHSETDLVDIDRQAAKLAAVREAAGAIGFGLVINARVDVFRFRDPDDGGFQEAVSRAGAYLEAGADCVYPIRLTEERLIGEFVQKVRAPVNIWARADAPSIPRLAELGVARVSHAADLMRNAYATLEQDLVRLIRAAPDGASH